MKVTFGGLAAHAGNHHAKGRNAIVAASKFCIEVSNLTDYAEGTTVNVGLIEGGTAVNTVADRCEVNLDIRFTENSIGDGLAQRIRDVANNFATDGIVVEVKGGVSRPSWKSSPENIELAKSYGRYAAKHGLSSELHPLVGGGSDANLIARLGIPCIDGLGPRGKGFHTIKETVEIKTLKQRADALYDFLTSGL